MQTNRVKIVIGILVAMIVLGIGGLFYYHFSEQRRHTFAIHFLNIGQGDSALIQFENGKTMLVDCGPNRRVLAELGKVLPFYIRTIDYVLATHSDLDHYGGCVDVLNRYHVKHIVINGHDKPYDSYWREWNNAIQNEKYSDSLFTNKGQHSAEIIVMASPTVWTIASDALQFISPDPALRLDLKADDHNNYSIVFKLTHREGRNFSAPTQANETFLFTGDMETPLEQALLTKYCAAPQNTQQGCPALQANVLKVGHHGSNSSSGEDFLTAVNPKIAVISVGKNKYGHPSLRVIRHLERAGATILLTNQHGAILWPVR